MRSQSSEPAGLSTVFQIGLSEGVSVFPETNQLNIHCLNVFISYGHNDMFPIYLLGFVKKKGTAFKAFGEYVKLF